MSVLTYEGIVENGHIRLNTDILLPEKTRVFVVIPNFETTRTHHLFSPRLANVKQALDFKLEIVEESNNVKI